jgi:hypothetical protein
MLIDKELEFSNNQSIVEAVGDVNSNRIVDAKAAGSPYSGLWLFVKIKEAVASATATAAVEFKLVTSADNFATSKVLFTTGAIGQADLTADKVIAKVAVPLGLERYTKMVYTISGEATTAGSVYAAFVTDVEEGL